MSGAPQGAFGNYKKIKMVRFRSAEGARAYRFNGAPRAAVHFTRSCVCFVRKIRRLDCRLRVLSLLQNQLRCLSDIFFRLLLQRLYCLICFLRYWRLSSRNVQMRHSAFGLYTSQFHLRKGSGYTNIPQDCSAGITVVGSLRLRFRFSGERCNITRRN